MTTHPLHAAYALDIGGQLAHWRQTRPHCARRIHSAMDQAVA